MKKINYIKLFCGIIPIGCFLLLSACSSKPSNISEQSNNISLCTNNAISSINGIDALGTPKLRTNIGNSHLAISTQKPKAQAWFDQGINLLHGFWHLEAYRAFREVIKADSTCAMGYWGLAMCKAGFGGMDNTFWENVINKADRLSADCSPIEKAFIASGAILVKNGIETAQMPFRQLYKDFPNEPEAIAFASIILRQHQNETTQKEVKHLLENAIRRFPDHVGLLHYYVHVMELRPEFALAIPAAQKMTRIAPNSPHIIHMPGHLYYLSGEYDKALDAFQAAFKQEYAYHKTENIPFIANQNYLHNLQFLAITQAERGNYKAASAAAKQLANITLSKDMPNDGAALMLLYEGRILPALVDIRFGEWQKAEDGLSYWLNSLDMPLKNPLVRLYLEAMRCYCRGMKSLQTGSGLQNKKIADATKQGMELTQLMQKFEQVGMQYQNTPEFKTINETYDILNMARYELAGWIDNYDLKRPFNVAAWQEAISLEDKIAYDEPPRLMYPINESLGRLHQYRNEKQDAIKAYHNALKKRPHSPMILRLKNKI